MKIAVFSDNFYPELSGTSDSAILLAKKMAELGHKIRFYAPKYSSANFRLVNLPEKEPDLGPNISFKRFSALPYPVGTKQGRLVIPSLGLRWLKNDFKPDIIHTHHFFGVGLEALSAAKHFNVPLVGTNHHIIGEFIRYSPLNFEWTKNLVFKYVAWYYNHCNFVTSPSLSIIEEIQKFGFSRPYKIISNPINVAPFKPASEEEKSRAKKDFNFQGPVILYAGRLSPEKHIDVILHAAAMAIGQIPNLQVALSGKGSSENKLKTLAKKLNIEKNVNFLGFLNNERFIELHKASDIFVIASTAEAQSLSLMQAMAAGLPAISVKARGLLEYTNNQNGILIDVGDVKALAEKIIYLINNKEERQNLGQGGVKFVQNFSADIIAGQWEQIYAQAVQNTQ